MNRMKRIKEEVNILAKDILAKSTVICWPHKPRIIMRFLKRSRNFSTIIAFLKIKWKKIRIISLFHIMSGITLQKDMILLLYFDPFEFKKVVRHFVTHSLSLSSL